MMISIIQIGSSKGIRLTKKILKQYNIKGRLELILEEDFIVLKPIKLPRGWLGERI